MNDNKCRVPIGLVGRHRHLNLECGVAVPVFRDTPPCLGLDAVHPPTPGAVQISQTLHTSTRMHTLANTHSLGLSADYSICFDNSTTVMIF